MIRSTGWAIHQTSRAVHGLLLLGIALVVVMSCLLAGAAWRLAQGPISLGWFAARLKTELMDQMPPVRLSFGDLALAWEGFHKGADYPLDLRVSDIRITDRTGRLLVSAPDAHVTFSLAGLLIGRFVPRTIEVDHGQAIVTREASGALDLDWSLDASANQERPGLDLARFLGQLMHPAGTDHGPSQGMLDQIRRLHFRSTAITLRDRPSGLIVRTSGMALDVTKAENGRIHGTLNAPLALGDQSPLLTAVADLVPGSMSRLEVELTPWKPAGFGDLPTELAFLGRVDVPISLTAVAMLDPGSRLAHADVEVRLGQGQLKIGRGDFPLSSGTIAIEGTADKIVITRGHLDLGVGLGEMPESIDFTGTVVDESERLTASLTAGFNRINIADLPRLWPIGIGGDARPWVIEHVTGGIATGGTATFVIESDEALHDVALTKATAELDASNAAFTWIDNVPPVEQADVHLHLLDPDTLDVLVTNGRQRISNRGADLLIQEGRLHIIGLSFRDQIAEIQTQIEGPVTSTLALLREPRLHLLSAHPIGVRIDGGEASAKLDIQLPLETKLRIDDVRIHANAHLTQAHVSNVAGGHELSDGTFDLIVDKDGLVLNGHASLANIPATFDGTMDFGTGGPDQIIQKMSVIGEPTATQLEAAGLQVRGVLSGPIPLTVVMIERRNGDGSVSIAGDLTNSLLEISPLAWKKPSGAIATATATLLMSHDRPTKVDRIAVRGDDLLLSGSANFTDGQIQSAQFDTIRVGRSRARGTVRIDANNKIYVILQGSVLDLSAKLIEKSTDAERSDTVPVTSPVWILDARFDRATLANGESATDVLAKAVGAGATIGSLDAIGSILDGGDFAVKIAPSGGKRRLSVDAKDAGRFLRGMDAIRAMQSGHLVINAVFGDPLGFHPLAGTALIDNVVVRNSPVLGKLLQAITLYGLVDVLRGPGITFSHIVVPFHYDGSDLYLKDARAENPSLGLTANGQIGLSSGQTTITGTIVPAYFFNSMLGQLPLVGKLFSPEKGGGVFAARFGLGGSVDDPNVSINPVSVLTPGFLREIFGVFDKPNQGASVVLPTSR